jgi:hypothetical protein
MKPKPKEEVIATTVRVPKTFWLKVQHCAVDEGLGTGELILKALAEYLKRERRS